MKLITTVLTMSILMSLASANASDPIAEFTQDKSGDREILKMYELEADKVSFKSCQLTTHLFSEDELKCTPFGDPKGYDKQIFRDFLDQLNQKISDVEIPNNCFNPTKQEYKLIQKNYHLLLKKEVTEQILFPESYEVKLSGSFMVVCDSFRVLPLRRFKRILRDLLL